MPTDEEIRAECARQMNNLSRYTPRGCPGPHTYRVDAAARQLNAAVQTLGLTYYLAIETMARSVAIAWHVSVDEIADYIVDTNKKALASNN